MLTPKQIQEIADTLLPLLDDLNTWITGDIIRRLLARIGRGEEPMLAASDEWQAQVLQEAGGHLEALQAEIQKVLPLANAELARIFEDAAIKALEADNRVYVEAGARKLGLSRRLLNVVEDACRRTAGTLHNLTRTTAESSQRKLLRVLDAAHMKVMTGAQSYTGAVRDAVMELAETQTQVVYPSGHVDSIETAVLRAVRTGTAQASGNLSIQGMEENGWDLVRVSAHLGARYGDGGQNPGNHFWWQGKLYTRTGKYPEYPPFVETTGYGTGEGLCGWNCRHSFGPGSEVFNPFQDYNAEENRKAYDLSQQQRKMERRIRHSKTKLMALQTAIDAAEDPTVKAKLERDYSKAAVRLGEQNKAYNQFCEDNGLKRYEDRLQVAKWGREEARRSIMAAKKAEKEEKTLANPPGSGIIEHMDNSVSPVTEQARRVIPHQESYGPDAIRVDMDYINSNEYRMKFHGITGNPVVDDRIAEQCKTILESRSGTYKETLVILDADKGSWLGTVDNSIEDNAVYYSEKALRLVENAKRRGHRLLTIHNHPEGYPPTADDCVSAGNRGYSLGVVCGHNGAVYTYEPASVSMSQRDCLRIHNNIAYQCQFEKTYDGILSLWIQMMAENGFMVRKWG